MVAAVFDFKDRDPAVLSPHMSAAEKPLYLAEKQLPNPGSPTTIYSKVYH